MTFDNRVFTRPLPTEPELTPPQALAPYDGAQRAIITPEERAAAEVLIRHLFAPSSHPIDGLEYGAAYALAEGAIGGDIVDVYHFDNGNVALSIADISGKGAPAAIHAALVKYGLRCYVSEGLTTERVLRSLDRAYIENNAFERTESFASVFTAIVDQDRRSLTYASAGHEPVLLARPGKALEVLSPTAPLIGVFDDQHHLFKQRQIPIEPGTVIFATTDGVTEARSPDRALYGMERLVAAVERELPSAVSMNDLIGRVLGDVNDFTAGRFYDDIAVLAVRIF